MRKAIRGFIRRDHRQDDCMPAPSKPHCDHIQHVADGIAVAAPSGQEPPAQSTESLAATSNNPAELAPENPASVSDELWARAYRALSEREPELARDYEKHLEAIDGCKSGAPTNLDSLRALVKSLQDRRENTQFKFSVRSIDHKVADQLKKLFKFLALADGVVKQALRSQQHAAFAWITVSVFVLLLRDGLADNMAMVNGFTTIGELQGYWKKYEDVYLRSTSSEHYQNLFEPLSNVYSYMLEYQVRAVCHLSKKQLSRAWQKVAEDSDWSGKETHIVKISDRCVASIAPLQREEMVQTLAAQNEKLEQIGNTENSILKTIKDHKQKDAEVEFLRALKSTAGNYKGGMEFNEDSVKGTCEWFFADTTFSSWRDTSDTGIFWLTAGPGCGKSVLARTLIKDGHLKNTTTTIDIGSSTITNSAATVCYFFFKDEDVQRTKITTALSALLHQLFCNESTSDLIENALPAFARSGSSLTGSFEDLWSALVTCAEKLACGDIICVLDALDECNSQDRIQLIRKLDSFYDNGHSAARANLKFLITSRAYDSIERAFRPLSKRAEYFRFDADERHKEISHDIGLVIDSEMESFASDFDDADRQKIAETLRSRGTKTYLWLHLTLRIMKSDPSQYSRQRDVDALLAEVPTQVSEAYEKILNKAKNERITSILLQIILAAARPLTVEEANYALTLALEKDGIETHAQLEAERWKTGFETIVKNFAGLIISIYDGKLSFIHLTAQEYLVRETEPGSPATKWGGRFANDYISHGLMSRCCLNYLLLPELALRTSPLCSSGAYPLLEYAAGFWPQHFEKQDAISKQSWMQQARRLCKGSEQPLKVWGPIYRRQFRRHKAKPTFFGWTGLAVAAYLGLFTVVGKMLDDEAIDINEYSAEYGSALNASIVAKEITVVELLISRGADVAAPCPKYGPPLFVAAGQHSEDIISLLLANGASPLQKFTVGGGCTTTVLQRVVEEELMRHFDKMVSAIVDISTPDRVLEALAEETVLHCMSSVTAMLLNLLPDERLGEEMFLSPDVLQTVLGHSSTRKKALHLIVQQKRQAILLESSLLSPVLKWRDARQIVRSVLQEMDVPCAHITQDVLEDCAGYGDAETLKTLVRYCPEGVLKAKGLLLAANGDKPKYWRSVAENNMLDNIAMCEVVMDTVGESFYHDHQLQNELLEKIRSPVILHAFLRLPRFTVQVSRCLVQVALRHNARWRYSPKDMVTRILDRCTDKNSVIDATVLVDGARHGDKETVLLLLELGDGALVTKAMLLEAAANNFIHGKAVMGTLLQDDDDVAAITPVVVLAAADTCNGNMEWLLEEHVGPMATRAELSPNAGSSPGSSEVLETLVKRRVNKVAKLAPLALRMAAEDNGTGRHNSAIERLIPYCANSLVGANEDFILDLLEGSPKEVESVFMALVATVGDDIVLTERILARAASHPRLLETLLNRRPGEVKFTPSLIAMIAAGGHIVSLEYLAKDGHAIGEEWYRLARLREIVRMSWHPETLRSLRELWEEGDIPDKADANGRTAVHAAAAATVYTGYVTIPFLVDVAKLSVDAVDRHGWTALHYAGRGRGFDPAEGLLLAQDLALTKALVLAGADPHKADYQGRTPLTMAQDYIAHDSKSRTRAQKMLAVLHGDGQVEATV